jgi:hypothetical protein
MKNGCRPHRSSQGSYCFNSTKERACTAPGPDGQLRCHWCLATPQYLAYHDGEWGFPVTDDRRLFEKLCLEGFQAGLSWRTILEKRENFRRAFAGFDIDVLAGWGAPEVDRLLQDAGIVRHRGKIESVLNNARARRTWCVTKARWRRGSGATSQGPASRPRTRA